MTSLALLAARIDRYWDEAVLREPHADPAAVSPEQAETIAWFLQMATPVADPNRDRAWLEIEQRIGMRGSPKDPPAIAAPNIRAPLAAPQRRPLAPTKSFTSRSISWISIALLIALLGGIFFEFVSVRDREDSELPALIASPAIAPPPSVGSDWGEVRGNGARTGATNDPGPGGDLHLRWTFTAPEDLESVVEADGMVYAFGRDNVLYALDAATGSQLWAITLANGHYGRQEPYPAPAIAEDTVLVPSTSESIHALDRVTGDRRWNNYFIGYVYSKSTPTLAGGRVIVATQDRVNALDFETGSLVYNVQAPGTIVSVAPTIAGDSVVFTLDTGALFSIAAATGEQNWVTEPLSSAGIVAYRDDVLYVPGPAGIVTALDAISGASIWQADLGSGNVIGLSATDQGIVATVDGSGVSLLDRTDGSVIWTHTAPGIVNAPIVGGSTVYVTSNASTLVVLDLNTGQELGRAPVTLAGATTALSGQLLFVGGQSGIVQVFGPTDAPSLETRAQVPHHSILPRPETPLPQPTIGPPTSDDPPSTPAPEASLTAG